MHLHSNSATRKILQPLLRFSPAILSERCPYLFIYASMNARPLFAVLVAISVSSRRPWLLEGAELHILLLLPPESCPCDMTPHQSLEM